jgi:hypothetical protein
MNYTIFKNTCIVCLIIFSSTSYSLSQGLKTKLEDYSLIGEVKAIKETTQIFNGIILGMEYKKDYFFNIKGNMYQYIIKSGDPLNTRITYNEYGLKESDSIYNVGGDLEYANFYEYNDSQLLSHQTGYSYSKTPKYNNSKIFEYDDDNNLIKVIDTIEISDLGWLDVNYQTTYYKYDNQNNIIEECEFSVIKNEEKINKKSNYKYDTKHREIESEVFRAKENITTVTKTSYYDNGLIKEQVTENYNLLQQIEYSRIIKHKYEYDKIGNWTKHYEYMDGTLISTINSREIDYY